MGKSTQKILKPNADKLAEKKLNKGKLAGGKPFTGKFTGKNKPLALIVSSPYDVIDSSTNLKSKQKHLEEDGFGIMNKKAIYFDSRGEDLENCIKFSKVMGGDFTIFVNAHGAPGWLFGEDQSAKSEMSGLFNFTKLIRNIEHHTGKTVKNIVLSGCYTAVEIYNPVTGKFMNSPARLLSMVFPDKCVVGFIGQYADGKVTHIFKEAFGVFTHVVRKPADAGILFKGGRVIERPYESLYSTHEYTPFFIKKALGLEEVSEEDYFRSCFVKEANHEANGRLYIAHKNNLGHKQISTIPTIMAHLDEEVAETPSARMRAE